MIVLWTQLCLSDIVSCYWSKIYITFNWIQLLRNLCTDRKELKPSWAHCCIGNLSVDPRATNSNSNFVAFEPALLRPIGSWPSPWQLVSRVSCPCPIPSPCLCLCPCQSLVAVVAATRGGPIDRFVRTQCQCHNCQLDKIGIDQQLFNLPLHLYLQL